jgi:beta-phosphoglucomutase
MRSSSIPPSGIVFDMDGVLLNSSSIHDAAYREALAALPLRVFDYSRIAGLRTRDGILTVLAENNIVLSDEEVAALAASKSRLALECIRAQNPITPGAPQVLETLSKLRKLALASSASPETVNTFLDQNGLRPFFQCVVHSGDVVSAKPSPEIFETAARGLALSPSQCLVVEDAVAGVQAAKAAGAMACGILSTCSVTQLKDAGADFIINRLEDLLEIGAAA